MHEENQGGIKVIRRAANVLRALREAPGGLSLGQIAGRIGLARSTVQRIVAALQAEGLVAPARHSGGFALGRELHAIAAAARLEMVEDCRLLLQEIAEATGETVDLSVLRGEGMILLDQVEGRHRLRTVTPLGEIFPLASTANGRAALAMLDPRAALLLAGFVPDSAEARALVLALAATRESGLGYDRDEHTEGICAMGFAFRDRHGDIYAISVPVPRARFAARHDAIRQALTRARLAIEQLTNSDMKITQGRPPMAATEDR